MFVVNYQPKICKTTIITTKKNENKAHKGIIIIIINRAKQKNTNKTNVINAIDVHRHINLNFHKSENCHLIFVFLNCNSALCFPSLIRCITNFPYYFLFIMKCVRPFVLFAMSERNYMKMIEKHKENNEDKPSESVQFAVYDVRYSPSDEFDAFQWK